MSGVFQKLKEFFGQVTSITTPIGGVTRERHVPEVPLLGLREKMLRRLGELRRIDVDAFVPVDDLIKNVGLDSRTGDQVLQLLRDDGEIQAIRHPDVEQNLVKLTAEGIDHAERLLS